MIASFLAFVHFVKFSYRLTVSSYNLRKINIRLRQIYTRRLDSKLYGAVQWHLRYLCVMSMTKYPATIYQCSTSTGTWKRRLKPPRKRQFMHMYSRMCHRLRRDRSDMRVQFPDCELTISSLEKICECILSIFLLLKVLIYTHYQLTLFLCAVKFTKLASFT